jgi:flagella basal body P-ring formation protein FlgA
MRRLPTPIALLAAWLWLPPLATSADTVLAPGQPLTPEAVAGLVREALAARGTEGRLTVAVDAPAAPLPNGAAAPMRVTVAELRYEPRTGRYDARLLARLPTGQSSVIASVGQVTALVEVPVLSRPIERGEIIRAQDVGHRSLAATALGVDTVQQEDELVGMQAARPLAAGRALRARDLVAPMLVRPGEPATMVFARGGLEVTGAGVALDQGRQGDTVRVQNAGSGEIRRAVVVGPRRVRLSMEGPAP